MKSIITNDSMQSADADTASKGIHSSGLRMPDRLASRLRSKDASLVLAARNLKVWTKYKGADPEENYVTTDVQNTFASSAPRSYYTVRLNLHY